MDIFINHELWWSQHGTEAWFRHNKVTLCLRHLHQNWILTTFDWLYGISKTCLQLSQLRHILWVLILQNEEIFCNSVTLESSSFSSKFANAFLLLKFDSKLLTPWWAHDLLVLFFCVLWIWITLKKGRTFHTHRHLIGIPGNPWMWIPVPPIYLMFGYIWHPGHVPWMCCYHFLVLSLHVAWTLYPVLYPIIMCLTYHHSIWGLGVGHLGGMSTPGRTKLNCICSTQELSCKCWEHVLILQRQIKWLDILGHVFDQSHVCNIALYPIMCPHFHSWPKNENNVLCWIS